MSGTKSQHGGHGTDKDSDYVDAISTNNPGTTPSGDSIYDFPSQKSYKHNPYVGSSLTELDSGKELYMDTISAGDRFLEFDREHQVHRIPPTQFNQNALKQNGKSAASDLELNPDCQSTQQVYFILEKQDPSVTECEQYDNIPKSYTGQTLAREHINVAHQAKVFEGARIMTTQMDPSQAFHTGPVAQNRNSDAAAAFASTKDDENIYEITFSEDQKTDSLSRVPPPLRDRIGENEVVTGPPKALVHISEDYELAKPLTDVHFPSETTTKTGSLTSFSGSGRYPSCKQGTARNGELPVMPSREEIEDNYNRLHFERTSYSITSPEEPGYDTLGRVAEMCWDSSEPVYDQPWEHHGEINNRTTLESGNWSDDGWGSSDFDSISDEEGYEAGTETQVPVKPLPHCPSSLGPGENLLKTGGFLNRLKPKTLTEDDEATCLPVTINTIKHPPPELPPPPNGLSDDQRKRRCVIELTINSEKSYIESLERIVQVYEKPILEVISHPKAHIRMVFRQAEDIVNHHKMFQIELAEAARHWDEEEKIGDIFTACFTKTMLINAYSIYVNNFAAGMDEIRTTEQSRASFEEFLRAKERAYPDRLSIFGLMVKPIQRFPQFIMLLQDLLKYTPPSHNDRRALQLALTELENVTHKLNERKRFSEQYFQAKQTMQLLPRQFLPTVLSSRNLDQPRRLIRFDNVEHIQGEMETMKSVQRRLILMNDLLICVKVGVKDQDGYMMERYRLKWAAKLTDIELKESMAMPDMTNIVKMDPARLRILSSQFEQSEDDPFHLGTDLRDMLHDLTVLTQMSQLMKTLRRNYQGHGFSEELIEEMISDLQNMIHIKDEQLHLVNSCTICLVDNSRADKPHYIIHTPTATIKNEWCVDFCMAKLALEKQNMPGWDHSPLAKEDELEHAPALFMKCVPVDVPRNFTKVKCATSVFIPSPGQINDIGMRHLWVCSSLPNRGLVSVVSLHNSRPVLSQTFKASECELVCVEVVPGCGAETDPSHYLFCEDTVWMSNTHNEILVFPIIGSGSSTVTREPLAVVRVPGNVITIKFVDERLFCGLDDGAMLVYSRNDAGEWCIKAARTLNFGQSPVKCQVVVDEKLWVACSRKLYIVEIDTLKMKPPHILAGDQENSIIHMVRSGVGMWVAFQNSATLRLYHIETLDNLQEMSVSNIINRVITEKLGPSKLQECVVTCLAASTGFLWIGTSLGLIITLPMPRLSDGVPQYRGRPSVAYHAHRGPVRFIIPVYCSSSVLELHRKSSLRSSLFIRPSIRNRKREQIESLGALPEDKLLSSGGEVELSTSSTKAQIPGKGLETPKYIEVLPPTLPDMLQARDSKLIKKKWSLGTKQSKNNGKKSESLSESLRQFSKAGRKVKLSKSRTLSFRSELANRIKNKALGKFQAVSMFDLTAADTFEVGMLYENLLDAGDDESDSETETVNVTSESSLASISEDGAAVAAPPIYSNRDRVVSLDLATTRELSSNRLSGGEGRKGFGVSMPDIHESAAEDADRPKSNTISDVTIIKNNIKHREKQKMKLTLPKDLNSDSFKNTDEPPSPRLASIRAKTMRKTSTSNAVMVLSGGDGYMYLNNGLNSSKSDDACLLFWIYKF